MSYYVIIENDYISIPKKENDYIRKYYLYIQIQLVIVFISNKMIF